MTYKILYQHIRTYECVLDHLIFLYFVESIRSESGGQGPQNYLLVSRIMCKDFRTIRFFSSP
jgi:hypothetical protein